MLHYMYNHIQYIHILKKPMTSPNVRFELIQPHLGLLFVPAHVLLTAFLAGPNGKHDISNRIFADEEIDFDMLWILCSISGLVPAFSKIAVVVRP